MTNPTAKRRVPFWAIALVAAGSAAGAATLAVARSPKAPVAPVAALAPPADLDYAYRAFDAFRDQPQGPAASSTAALTAGDTRL